MSNVSFKLRLRPVRFAFLVRTDDGKRLHEIFRINTCLWGGKFNPIIPFFKRLPAWWDRRGIKFENAKQIINGYLDYFEPDFLVEAEKGLADKLDFDPTRVLILSDLLAQDRQQVTEKYGMDVDELYGNLYQEEFRFEQRRKQNIVYIKARSAVFNNFAACVFGGFPSEERIKDFKTVFTPEEVLLDAESLFHLYKSGFTSALEIGCRKLKVDYSGRGDPTLFIHDAQQPKDLIDYWNLRAINHNVIPVPIQWLNELSPFCKQFVLNNYRPLPGNQHGVMMHSCSMFSRSIPEGEINKIYSKFLRVEINDANLIQTWYPPIWREQTEFAVRRTRPMLVADSKLIDVNIDENKPVRFDPLFPQFANDYFMGHRWANIVNFDKQFNSDLIATVFPQNYKKKSSFPKFRMGQEHLLSTTEGLVFFPKYKMIQEYWDLTDGTTALKTWLNENNITAVPSDAGRATQQIVQTLGGFLGVSSLAHREIIELLDKVSRKPVTKSMRFHEFKNKITNAASKGKWGKSNFMTIVERQAVQLGLELKCTKCGNWSWYSIKHLDYSLSCDLCLKEFDFPISNPSDSKHSKWSYRLIGPFALPDYARGGYATALSIRFFSEVFGIVSSSLTWSSGLELTLGESSFETDFILWIQRKQILAHDYPTEIVFGEVKSFGKDVFKASDITKMKLLAETFPGCIIVFATMKEAEEFSPEEIERIRRFALWGREYDAQRKQQRAPVIVLTGTELFADFSLENAWKNKGGKHKDLTGQRWVHTDSLDVLANFTQQLYLGMPSYEQWREDKWKKHAERRKEKSS